MIASPTIPATATVNGELDRFRRATVVTATAVHSRIAVHVIERSAIAT